MLEEMQASDPRLIAQRARTRRRMLALIGGPVASAVVAGVAYWATRPPRVAVNFVTQPFEATIYLDNVLLTDANDIPYRTPCTVPNVPAQVHHVTFRHDDREELLDAGRIDFANTRQIDARWPPGP
jgi:hypothetical protein